MVYKEIQIHNSMKLSVKLECNKYSINGVCYVIELCKMKDNKEHSIVKYKEYDTLIEAVSICLM